MKNAIILVGVFVFIIILTIIDIFKQRKETMAYEERIKELRKEPLTVFVPENSFIIRKVKEITFKDYEELNKMLNSSNQEDDLILNILRLDETESGKKAVLLVTTCGKIGDLQK